MLITTSKVLSVREVNQNFPAEILAILERRFCEASVEFKKMKRHQANLKAKRGYPCPWANKLSEYAWVRRVRRRWQSMSAKAPKKKPGRPGWGFATLLKIWIFAAFFGCEQNAEEIASELDKNPRYAKLSRWKIEKYL